MHKTFQTPIAALPSWSFLCRKETLRMTAILVFSSPSLVPLRAAFISCWTWWKDTRQRRSDEEEDMGKRKGKRKKRRKEEKEVEKDKGEKMVEDE